MADVDGLEKSQSFLSEEKVPWKDEEEVIPYDIYTACSLGEHNFVREWLSKGIISTELNSYNSGGWTALMYAAYVGHEKVVNLLLHADVDVNVKTRKLGSTPLMLAASCGNKSVAGSLLKSGADIDTRDKQGRTALYYATHQGHQNVVELLIENGANKELRERNKGLTPLLVAAKEGREIIFKMILESGANTEARTSQGETLRQLALRYGNISVVNILDRERYKHASCAILRSEAGLFGIDVDGEEREYFGYYDNRLHSTGVQDGPEAIAKLMNQRMEIRCQPSPHPEMISRYTGQVSTPQPIPGASPRYTPDDAHTPVGSIGSPEDCFVNTGCSTMRSLILHDKLQQLNLEDQGRSPCACSPINHAGFDQRREGECCTPELPTLARFLEDLKLGKYLAVFEQQKFDFESFLTLDDAKLREIGINLLGPRKKIVSAINRWKRQNRQWACGQLQTYRAQLSQEREFIQEVLQNETAVREQCYGKSRGDSL